MVALGYLYIEEANFAFPQMLYESECHRRSFLRGSDTSTRMTGTRRCPVSNARSTQKFGGKNNKKNKNMKK